MTIRYGQGENSNQEVVYLSGDRKRMEFRNSTGEKKADGSLQQTYGPRLVAITRCDLGQMFYLNLDDSQYTSAIYPPRRLTRAQIMASGLQMQPTSETPTLRIEISTSDTGERKEMFGRIARHVITTRKQIPLAGSHSQPQESVTDAWFLDLETRLSCDVHWRGGKNRQGYSLFVDGKQPRERVELIATGESDAGFPIQSLTTTKSTYAMPDGTTRQANSISEMALTQFEEGPLDPALFEIPAGFKHVAHIERNLMPSESSWLESLWLRLKATTIRIFGI